MKKFLSGLLTGMLLAMTLAVFAASTVKSAWFNDDIRLQVNGAYIGTEVLSVVKDGSTSASSYVSARALADALGATVEWRSNTIVVTSPDSAAAQSAPSGSLLNPAPIGTTVRYSFSDVWQTGTVEASVVKVIRGVEAWDMVRTAGSLNAAPAEGYEYLLAKIRFKLNSISDDEILYLDNYSFTLTNSERKDYRSPTVTLPQPAFKASLELGEQAEGWAAFLVKSSDKYPRLTYGRDYNGTGGIWFKAY